MHAQPLKVFILTESLRIKFWALIFFSNEKRKLQNKIYLQAI